MIVLDASAMGALLLPDEDGDGRERIARAFAEHDIIVPPHFAIEVGSLLLKAVRRGRLRNDQPAIAFAQAERFCGQVAIEARPPLARIVDVAARYGLSAYDSTYLCMALDRQLPVLTIDGPLGRVAQRLDCAA